MLQGLLQSRLRQDNATDGALEPRPVHIAAALQLSPQRLRGGLVSRTLRENVAHRSRELQRQRERQQLQTGRQEVGGAVFQERGSHGGVAQQSSVEREDGGESRVVLVQDTDAGTETTELDDAAMQRRREDGPRRLGTVVVLDGRIHLHRVLRGRPSNRCEELHEVVKEKRLVKEKVEL